MSSDAGPGGHAGPAGETTDAETMGEMAAASLGPDSFGDPGYGNTQNFPSFEAQQMANVNAEPAYGDLANDFPGFVGEQNSFGQNLVDMITIPNAIKAVISYVAPPTFFGKVGANLANYAVDQIGRNMDTYDVNQDESKYAEMGEPTAPAPSTDDEGGGPYERNRNYLLPTPMMASAATVAPSMTDSPQVLTPYVNRKQSWNNGNFILAPISRRQV